VLEPGREGVDLQPCGCRGQLPGRPALRGGHLEGRNAALWPCGRYLGCRAQGHSLHVPPQPAPANGTSAYEGHRARKDIVCRHRIPPCAQVRDSTMPRTDGA
jgi:hypothetical protein